jgi:hypothetical protein
MRISRCWAACNLVFFQCVWAQGTADLAEWVEEVPPAPPRFSTDHLIPIDMPRFVGVEVSVDPESISVGADGVVHYVVVMRSKSGGLQASFEGIRCATDEVKTYAYFGGSLQWSMVARPQWRGIHDNLPSKHALAIARQGACANHIAWSVSEIQRALVNRKNIRSGSNIP